jgi:RNA recognition motif-containing protein
LFVGSLPFDATDDDLLAVFGTVGEVVSAKVIMDRDSGRSKGFGFVEMAHITENDILLLDGFPMRGRRLTVNVARPMPERSPRPDRYGGDRHPRVSSPVPEVVQPVAETSGAEEIGPMVDAIFVEFVWEGTDKARQSDELLGSRR